MSGILRWLDDWAEEFCVSVMLALLVLLLGMEVFSRFLLGKSFSWMEELCRVSVRVVILYRRRHRREAQGAAAHPYVHGCAEEAFPAVWCRILYVVSELTFTVFCALVFYYSLGMLENMIRFKQVSAALEINVMYAYLIIPISMAVTIVPDALQGLCRDFRNHTLDFQGRGD